MVRVDELAHSIKAAVDSTLADEVIKSLDAIYGLVSPTEAMTKMRTVTEQQLRTAQKEAEAEARARQYFERANWGGMPSNAAVFASMHNAALQVVEVTDEEWRSDSPCVQHDLVRVDAYWRGHR